MNIKKVPKEFESELSEDELMLYILNETNIYIEDKFINDLLKRYDINYKIKNIDYYRIAMVHPSYAIRNIKEDRLCKVINEKKNDINPLNVNMINKVMKLQKYSYERFEFLGDSILHCILAKYLFSRFPTEDEGFMTRLRTKIENGSTLAEFSKKCGFNKYMIIAKIIEFNGGRDSQINILEDVFEAFIGALYYDSKSDDICNKFVIKLIEENIDFPELISNETNFKDILNQYYHKMCWIDPEYGLLNLTENNNQRIFTMYVKGFVKNNDKIEWAIVGQGINTCKKKAEQEAAKKALILYNQISNNNFIHEEEIYDVLNYD